MFRKVIAAAIVCGSLALVGCNTVRGAAADAESAADCTQNAINGGRC